MRFVAISTFVLFALSSAQAPAREDDFYRGKSVTIVAGSPPGGGFDLVARLVGRHISDKIPGRPTVIVMNMPGASGLRAFDYLASAAPRDGTTFGITLPSAYLTRILDRSQNIKPYQMTWIGRVAAFRAFGVVRSDEPLQSITQKDATTLSMGAEGPTGLSSLALSALNDLYGSKFKIINGYDGNRQLGLAIERGELQGSGSLSWEYLQDAEWAKKRLARFIFSISLTSFAKLPDVPALPDLVTGDDAKGTMRLIASSTEIGRALVAPPNIPDARTAILRKAFSDMIEDKDFQADAEKLELDLEPRNGAEMQELVASSTRPSTSVMDRVRAYMSGGN